MMLCYFDTSAFVPLLIEEPASAACRQLWDNADDVSTSQLLYVEAAAALAQAVRTARITRRREAAALADLDRYWPEFNVVEPSEPLVRRAAVISSDHHLRGYDAVHCASAEAVYEHALIFATGDTRPLKAARSLGFGTADVGFAGDV
jgi:predicted nucleic acid-binding protein